MTTPPGVTATTAAPESTKATPDAVLAGLKAAGLPVTLIVTYDEATDPNKLLGRPSGYEGKNAFSDSRLAPDASVARDAIERGGSVEVYPTADGAEARAKYIQAIGAPLANEYDYVSGRVLVRVTGELPPSQAKAYESALKSLDLD